MKTLLLFTLVSVALAAPALQEEASERLRKLELQAHRSIPESVKREKKSPTELKPSTVLHSSASNTGIHTDEGSPIQTGRSFALKTPVIVKKKYGYHLYRDSEEEKANADSHEQCGRQVKVKLCDEDGKFREMLRSSGHEISDSTSENNMKHSIMMAREAIENLQRDFKRIEQKSASGKLDSKPDTKLHDDIEVTRQALEDIHKNFENFENLETMSLSATALRDSDSMQNLHIRIANTEEEKRAQWKAAIENIHKNVEIAQNIENSLKTVDDQEKLLHLHLDSNVALSEDHMRVAQTNNQKIQSKENTNDVEQGRDKTTFGHAREEQESVEDIAPSASEVIEMKAVDIANHHSLRSENHKRDEPQKNTNLESKEQGTGFHNRVTSNVEKLNKNAEEKLVETLPNISSSTGSTLIIDGFSERKTEISDLDDKMKELHNAKILEENNKNEINEEVMTTTQKTMENMKSKLEDHHAEANEASQSLSKNTDKSKKFDHQTFDEQTENSMKAADPSDHVTLNNFHLEGKHRNIDNNESEHTAALMEMKSAEDNVHHVGSIDFNSQTSHENGHLSLMKKAEPSDLPLNDIHIQNKHHNIDYNESEHTATLTGMKAAENSLNHQVSVLKALETVEDDFQHAVSEPSNSHWGHETRPLISLKTADPSDQIPLNEIHIQNKHQNIDYNESEHTATLTEKKAAENNLNHQTTVLKALEAVENNLHDAVSEPLNSHWDHETRPLTSLKTADPSDQVPLNDLHLLHKPHNIDYNESEHAATLTEMKAAENNLNHQATVLKALEAVEDNLHHAVSVPINAHWDHETRPLISLKTADPSDQVPLNDLHLLHKHHNIDYNDSEHTAALADMKTAENNLNRQVTVLKALEATEDNLDHAVSEPLNSHWNHETRPLISLKTADPSDQIPLNDLHLLHKHHNIDYNESEHTATLADMKTAENNLNRQVTVLKALETTEDKLHHAVSEPLNVHWDHENRPSISMKTVDPSDQGSFRGNDLHLHHTQHNIDENESEHAETFTQMKTSEDHIHPAPATFKAMEVAESHLLHPKSISSDVHRSHESRQMTMMKAAQPLGQDTLKGLYLQRKHNNIDNNESEQTATSTEIKSAEDHLHHHLTALRGMKAVEDHFHHPDSIASNVHWNQEKQHLTSMKMADPTNQLSLDHLPSQHQHQSIDHNLSAQHTAKLIDMKTSEDQVHQHLTATQMKDAEDHFHRQQSIPSTHLGHKNALLHSIKSAEDFRNNRHELDQMRNSHVADHHFTHSNIGQSNNFDSTEYAHQHANLHRFHHNLVHSDFHDMNMNGGGPTHFNPSLRDAMEGLESEHMFRWKPSHENFRSSYAANPISSGGAVGVFPHANTGGCGIPLLLSCSPSVVSGSLAKAHGTSYSAPSYSGPSYRTEEDFSFHNKRDTKKTNEMKNNNALRSPTIVKQKTKTILDSKF